MSLDRIKAARKRAIGSKQTIKAIEKGTAKVVYIAREADDHVTKPLVALCQNKGVEVVWVDSMTAIGRACGIEVGAAAVAVTEE